MFQLMEHCVTNNLDELSLRDHSPHLDDLDKRKVGSRDDPLSVTAPNHHWCISREQKLQRSFEPMGRAVRSVSSPVEHSSDVKLE